MCTWIKLSSLFKSSSFSIWKSLSSSKLSNFPQNCFLHLGCLHKTSFHAETHFEMCRLTITWQYFQAIITILFKTSKFPNQGYFDRLWKQSQNTKQVDYSELFKTRSFSEERLKVFQKQGDYSHSRGDGENWNKIGKSPRRMERDGRSEK